MILYTYFRFFQFGKHFPRYWPSVWGIHRSPVNSPHKGQWSAPWKWSALSAKSTSFTCHMFARKLQKKCILDWANEQITIYQSVRGRRIRRTDGRPNERQDHSIGIPPCNLNPPFSRLVLQWRHNVCNGVSNHLRLDCLLNRFVRRRSKKTPAPLAFVRRIHRLPVNSPHKGPVTRKMFHFDDVIMVVHILPVCFAIN